jgi:hypothetical protein
LGRTDSIGSTVRVKVSDVTDPTVYDESDSNLKIRGDLVLTAPNGGEAWLINSSKNITWTRFGTIANAKLEYSIDAGVSYPYVIAGSVNAANQSYAWSIPDNATTQARVRISDAADSTVNDISNGNFIIRGGFVITAPNGGEAWAVGSAQSISWTTYGSYANIKLWYSTDAGSTWNIITGSSANSGAYAWTIPDAISSACRVQIAATTDIEATDTSDADFKIKGVVQVTSPNGGEAWGVSSSRNITWSRTGTIATVKLEYSTNAFATEAGTVSINDAVPAAAGSYAWTVPDAIGMNLKVRVTDASDSTVSDVSDSSFRIRGMVTITSPNGGEAWIVGSSHSIVWTTAGSVGSVKLEYSTDAAVSWNQIVASIANAGTYKLDDPGYDLKPLPGQGVRC